MGKKKIISALAGLGALVMTSSAFGAVTPLGPNDRGNCKFEINGVALQGDDANDTIKGTANNDFIAGGGGDDRINGKSGSDCLYGQDGNDKVKGGRGKDLIKGGKDDDRLEGQAGNDTIRANKGNDRLLDTQGRNRLYCGPGIDTVITNRRSFVAQDCENVTRGPDTTAVRVPPGQSEADQYFETVPDGSGNKSLSGSTKPSDVLSDKQIAALEGLGKDGKAAAEIAAATGPDGAGAEASGSDGVAEAALAPSTSVAPSDEGLGWWLWLILIGAAVAVGTYVLARSRGAL